MEQNERAAVVRGDDAARVLDSPAFAEAFQAVKEQIAKQWKESSIRDAEGQRLLLQFARVADDFERILRSMVAAGDYAQAQIDLRKLRSESKTQQFLRKVL